MKTEEPSELQRKIAELEAKAEQLDTIKGTLMVNFNEKYGVRFGLVLKDEGSVTSLVHRALEHLAQPWIDKEKNDQALIQHGRELERHRINQEESCPDCGESFAEYVLAERGWENKPIPEEQWEKVKHRYCGDMNGKRS